MYVSIASVIGFILGFLIAKIAYSLWQDKINRFLDNTLGKIWPFNRL